MPDTLEDVQLTDTTTSYRIRIDHVDLTESLDQSYARNRASHDEQKQSADKSPNQPAPSPNSSPSTKE